MSVDINSISSESEPLTVKSNSNNELKEDPIKCNGYWYTLLSKVLPCLHWMPKYNWKYLQCDVIAGITVGLTVIPQGLAYAQIAGLPVQYGLYTAFMGGFVYCILGTSKDVTLGPTAIMSLLVHEYGNKDPIQAVLLTLLGGCIQLAMGIFRLGFIMRYLSVPVVSGFTSAAAITIGFGQVKHILGVKTTSSEFIPEVIETFRNIPQANVWDILVGLSCIALLLLLKLANRTTTVYATDRKWQCIAKRFMWLVSTGRNAIIVISAAAIAFAIHSQHIKSCRVPDCLTLTGNITKGLPPFKPPEFTEKVGNTTVSTGTLVSRIGVGLAVVPLMGFLESIAIGKAFARKSDYNLDINQEMIAIGVANIFSSFVSSYTITGSFSRTAINYQSNVKTPAGGVFTGFLVILGLALLTQTFYFIPKAALAAVIISAVIFMIDFATIRRLWQVNKIDLIPLAVTFLVCFWEIPYGIIAGVVLSLLLLLYPVSFPRIQVTTVSSIADVHDNKQCLVVLVHSGLDYPSAEFVYNKVNKEASANHGVVSSVILDFQHVSNFDYTVAQMMEELSEDLKRMDMQLIVISAYDYVRNILVRVAEPGSIEFYKDLDEARSVGRL
ncbi:unnamed protein product [Clavelina lepadiformis]|uniref:STAS domain-containing protein n=1 Tax=Clavelina lepadiformis TaxID=159417 RepID=A0ABP0GN93_CLALP